MRDRVGLSPVVGPHDAHPAGDIVFIHGLGGGSHSSWMRRGDAASFWPAWLAEDEPDTRIWVLGYAADPSAWRSESMPIADRGTALLETLSNEGIGERPVVFITHSMGGLLAKQLLRHADSFGVRRWEEIARRTRGIVFIATPHAGADLAGFADFARLVLRTNEQVTDLKAHHSRLRELHNWFRKFQAGTGLGCRTFCETREVRPGILGLELPKGILVVNQTSAEPHMPGEVAVPLDEDHISICKPATREAPLYKSLRRFLGECRKSPGGRTRDDATLSPDNRTDAEVAASPGVHGSLHEEPVFTAEPIFKEPFDDNENRWPVGPDRNWTVAVRDGVLSCTNMCDEGDVVWYFPGFEFHDLHAEITVRFDVSREEGYAAYAGLILRHDDAGFYYFVINNGCGYAFGKHFERGEDRWHYLVENVSPAIQPGTRSNRLSVAALGGRFELRVNDRPLTTLSDTSFAAPGNVGVIAMSPTRVSFDDLWVRT